VDAAYGGDTAILGQYCGVRRKRAVGGVSDTWGRRPAIIIPAIISIFITPLYLWTENPTLIIIGFIIQGIFGGSIYGQNPSYLPERFPTEVRATAAGFVYHQGAIWGGL
jgi:MFS transporter, SHS family, lactate transporter